MKNVPIAVIGGGAVGKTLACDCVLGGNTDVRLYGHHIFTGLTEEERQTLPLTIWGPQKNARNYRREGSARPHLITDQLNLAMKGAKIVIVALPSSAHPSLFAQLIPYLEDGMIVHIMPDNYGALRLRKMMRDASCKKKVVIGGWNLPPFGARLKGKVGADAYSLRMVNRFLSVTGAAFPYTDQAAFMESIRSLAAFDCLLENNGVSSGDTILDADFSNLNAVLHIPTTILGVGVMENWGTIYGTANEFSIFCHAMCPTISKVQKQFYDEEIAVAKALGFTGKSSISPRHVADINRIFSPTQADIEYAQEVMETIRVAKEQGKGVVSLRGKMIDAPIVTRARQVLEMAKAMGVLIDE